MFHRVLRQIWFEHKQTKRIKQEETGQAGKEEEESIGRKDGKERADGRIEFNIINYLTLGSKLNDGNELEFTIKK